MPILTLPGGASLSWDDAAPPYAPPVEPSAVVAPDPAPVAPEESPSPSLTLTPEDVKAALNAVPPKWTATAKRFAKVLGAAFVASLAAYGGNLAAIVHDPTVAIAAAGTAVLAAGEKFIRWRE